MKRILVGLLLLLAIGVVAQAQDGADLRTINFDIPSGQDIVEVELTIEPNDVSVLFHVVADSPDVPLGLLEIYDPNSDETLYTWDGGEDNAIQFGFEPYTEESSGELGMFLPSAPQYDLEAGDYIFVFEAEEGAGTITSVSALVRSGNVDTMQAMDVNLLVLSFDSGLEDETEQANFQGVLRDHVDDLLNPHNLRLGDIYFIVPDEDTIDEFGYPEISEEDVTSLNEICATMSDEVGVGRALNVVLVDGFNEEEADEGGTAGIAMSSGNAGVITGEGSLYSCVVVSWEAYADDLVSQAANIIHESAHFMSLPHTTEADGEWYDLFDDTAECDASYDEDGDGLVDDYECGIDGGAKNFLFWTGDPDAGLTPYVMSADQAWVMRRHPLFYSVGN